MRRRRDSVSPPQLWTASQPNFDVWSPPGGTVFLGLENGLERRFFLDRFRSKLQAKYNPESLNRLLKRRGMPRAPLAGYRPVVRSMLRHGFGTPRVYAPLPDERGTQLVLPVDEPSAVRYFLKHLVQPLRSEKARESPCCDPLPT